MKITKKKLQTHIEKSTKSLRKNQRKSQRKSTKSESILFTFHKSQVTQDGGKTQLSSLGTKKGRELQGEIPSKNKNEN